MGCYICFELHILRRSCDWNNFNPIFDDSSMMREPIKHHGYAHGKIDVIPSWWRKMLCFVSKYSIDGLNYEIMNFSWGRGILNRSILGFETDNDVVGISLLTIGMSLNDNQLLSSVIACYSYSNKLRLWYGIFLYVRLYIIWTTYS